MPTYAQLQRESWWLAERQPPALAELCRRLRAHYGLSAVAVGSKGDNRHLSGYHRSRNWVKHSRYCTNRTYSVSRTPGDRSGGDGNWLAAVDLTLPRAKLIAACKRLNAAVRAGKLEKITEWYGNDDGDSRVDGYDNIANRVATSDSSHLWHLHISFDRGRVGEDHGDLFDVLTGTHTQEAQVAITNEDADLIGSRLLGRTLGSSGPLVAVALQDGYRDSKAALAQVVELGAQLAALRALVEAAGGSVDVAAVLAGVDERLAAHRAAVEADTRDAVADLAEGGAPAVRADAE